MAAPTAGQGPTVTRATEAEFALLEQLLQLYLHDFSEHAGDDVDEQGRYSYAWLDAYREEPERHAYVIRVDAHPAGFALVRAGDPVQMAEFFVLRKYRRTGIGARAAREIIAFHPGRWSISQVATNSSATAFWRRVIPAEFEETVHADGTVEQRFVAEAVPAG